MTPDYIAWFILGVGVTMLAFYVVYEIIQIIRESVWK